MKDDKPSSASMDPVLTAWIRSESFTLITHSHHAFPPGSDQSMTPFGAVLRQLQAQGAKRIRTIEHPLTREWGAFSFIREWHHGVLTKSTSVRRPNIGSLSTPFDLLARPSGQQDSVFLAFDPAAALQCLMSRQKNRSVCALWSIDFSPRRFDHRFLEACYQWVDASVSRRVDVHAEVSDAALAARRERHNLEPLESRIVCPVGVWDEYFCRPSAGRFESKRLVYLGSVDERNGMSELAAALPNLLREIPGLQIDVIGRGPCTAKLASAANQSNAGSQVRLHGFIDDTEEVTRLLGNAALGVAPFRKDENSFTAHADPGKLKWMAAAGLPVITTDVPPNWSDITDHAGGEVVRAPAASADLVSAVSKILKDRTTWLKRSEAAYAYAQRFHYERITRSFLSEVQAAARRGSPLTRQRGQ